MPTVAYLQATLQPQIAPGSDSEFLRLLNEADMRLLEFGRWRWTRSRITLSPAEGLIFLPETHYAILGAQVGGLASDIKGEESEFVADGMGEIEVGNAMGVFLIDQGLSGTTSAASVTIDPAGEDNSITFTATTGGLDGNDITVEIAAPAEQADVAVAPPVGTDVTVSPGTKSVMDISGVLSPDITGRLYAVTDPTWGQIWTSNGLTVSENTATNAYTVLRMLGPTWNIAAFDATGAQTFLSVGTTFVSAPTWPDDETFGDNGYGAPSITAANSTAQQVIDAVNAADTIVIASTSGAATGAVDAAGPAALSGGSDNVARTYKVTGHLPDGIEVRALCHYAPVASMDPTDVPRCPDVAALKLAMLAIIYEESGGDNMPKSQQYLATALKGLDNKEKTQRGNARSSINIRTSGVGVRGIRAFR